MQDLINTIVFFLEDLMYSTPYIVSLLITFFVIMVESILPILPLGVFIALDIHLFGAVAGFLIAWISTCLGCFLSFWLVHKLFDRKMQRKIEKDEKVDRLVRKINKLSFSNLVLIISLPFSPAFVINIAASLAKMDLKKFAYAIIISKIFVIIFWGYIGTSLIECITDMWVIIKVIILLVLAYIVSKIVMKKFKLD